MGLRRPRRRKLGLHLGEQDENSNWTLRDNVTYYGDQAKAAPGAARELLKVPRAITGGVRDMIADMRAGSEAIAPDDPVLAPVEGVDLETAAAVDAALVRRQVPRGDTAARDAVAQEHGVPAGRWEQVTVEWQARRERDPRVLQTYAAELQRRMRA